MFIPQAKCYSARKRQNQNLHSANFTKKRKKTFCEFRSAILLWSIPTDFLKRTLNVFVLMGKVLKFPRWYFSLVPSRWHF